jgi:hypothetical protein
VAESFKVSNIERLYFIGLWKGRIRWKKFCNGD